MSRWPPDARTLRLRHLTHRRAALSADATAVKNRIHPHLHQRQIRPPVEDLFRSEAGLAWLATLELDPDGRAALDRDLWLVRALGAELELLDGTIRQAAYEDDRARLVMTLPGVSYVTSVTLLAAWGDATR